MKDTQHEIFNIDSIDIRKKIAEKSVDLIITSPPYPMIQMWDEIFGIYQEKLINSIDVQETFFKAHEFLNKIWKSSMEILKDGGIFCINIGDATRNFNGKFQLFNNHQIIIDFFIKNNFIQLPSIIWKKQANTPNKFMGSGMLPVGAYVTLEHEYILIFRKSNERRNFKIMKDKLERRKSAFFWEERNVWFSDVWEFKGIKQKLDLKNSRNRSAAFPLELPYRLINMFSVQGDVIFDPFLGTGTTMLAAMMLGRNSLGIEIDKGLCDNFHVSLNNQAEKVINLLNNKHDFRLNKHHDFVLDCKKRGKSFKYFNENLNIEVMTKQEIDIKFAKIKEIDSISKHKYLIKYFI